MQNIVNINDSKITKLIFKVSETVFYNKTFLKDWKPTKNISLLRWTVKTSDH